MLKNFLLIIILPILLSSCEYTPIYSDKNNYNFYIEKINFSGDDEINSLLKNKLQKYMRDESNNKFTIEVESSYSKIAKTKDLAGKTTDFDLNLEVKFQVKSISDQKNFILKESFIMKNFSNKFEEKNYEKSIKNNLTRSVINNLIIQLSSM